MTPPLVFRGLDLERARGALLGLAVGDALGTTHEFTALSAPPFPALATGPLTDVVGGGPFDLVPGQVTDDTQMACCLASAIAESGAVDAEDVAARYAEWVEHAFDAGNQTRAALSAWRQGRGAVEAGRRTWDRSNRNAAGNGSLMRTAPIGVAFASHPASLREAALTDSAVTHFDPRCRLACAALDAAIAAALRGARTPLEVHQAARDEMWAASQTLREEDPTLAPVIAFAVGALEEDLGLALQPDPRLYDGEVHLHASQGFVRVAFRLAFWELVHAPGFTEGLLDVVNRGGDADTNGAIAGALLGAFHGERAIPAAWRDRVLGAVPRQEGPLRDRYHPRTLLALVPP